jgi:hypothetical protein
MSDGASLTRTTLLVVQATLSVVLVAGSTMLGRSLGNLEGQDFGFDRSGRVLVSVGRPSAEVTGERLTAMYRDVEAQLSRIPGVRAAGLALYNPLTNNWGEGVLVAGKPPAAPGTDTLAHRGTASARATSRIWASSSFADATSQRATTSDPRTFAVVNEAFVRRFFSPGEDPIDRRFGLNLPPRTSTRFASWGSSATPSSRAFNSISRRVRCSSSRWRRP